MAFSVAMVYSGLPDPTSSAGFITKKTYNGKGRENESQKVCKLMKGWSIKSSEVRKYPFPNCLLHCNLPIFLLLTLKNDL